MENSKLSPEEIRNRQTQICRSGYVICNKEFYRGCIPEGRKPDCQLCDHPGCDLI